MTDNSTLKGRVHYTMTLNSLINPDRWPFWYRRYKPDHVRSSTDNVRNEAVNVFEHPDVLDQSVETKYDSHNFFERVADNPDAYELIGQIKTLIFGVKQSFRTLENIKTLVTVGRFIAAHDYKVELGDHFIQLEEDTDAANRKEWKVISVALKAEMFYSGEVVALVGVYG